MVSSSFDSCSWLGLDRQQDVLWCLAHLILAGSNSVAGKLANYTAQQGLGNIGCFYGGAVASALAGVLLFMCSRFGDLSKEELVVTKKGGANLKPSKP